MNWEILMRYVNEEASDNETAEVELWLDERAENKIILKQLQLKKKQLTEPLKDDVIHTEWVKVLDRILENPPLQKSNIKKFYTSTAIAATVLLACFFSWLTLKNDDSKQTQAIVVKTATERRMVKLPDGSTVYLAPHSTLQINANYNTARRELTVIGEAFFDVKHDVKKPFLVSTSTNLKVNVLGTSFNVYARKGNHAEVMVSSGLVGVTDAGLTTMLKGGEQLSYSLTGRKMVKSAVDIRDAVGLQTGTFYFANSTTTQIAKKLHRYYDINIRVAPSALKKPAFSGEMKDYGITKVLDGIGFVTGTRHKFTDPKTILLY
ncbi:MAG: FecR domain-containing protein [Mucilaginibacter sp.]|jgi:ferric-dicitrate binding protein FerR (iron transport regulator)|uniref:FecR family protein n=1 Tax=Mucilaginibacter sp. TaxID=1882438 RepID=UPI00356AC311